MIKSCLLFALTTLLAPFVFSQIPVVSTSLTSQIPLTWSNVWEVSNGTTIAALGLELLVTHSTGQTCKTTTTVSPMPTTAVQSEWDTGGQFVPSPYTIRPTTGVFDNDTHYKILFGSQSAGSLGKMEEYWIVVGHPQSAGLSMSISFAGNAVQDGSTVTVPYNTAVAACNPVMTFSPGNMYTTVTPLGTTGIDLTEWWGGSLHNSFTVPTGPVQGTFNMIGQHLFRVALFKSNKGGSYIIEFTVDVQAPQIEVADSTGTISAGDAASGDRDFGQVFIGGTAGPTTITISNTSAVPMLLGTPQLKGADAANFALNLTGLNKTLGGGQQTSLEISYAPLATGTHSATVEFTHDDPTVVNPFTFDVAGVCIDPATNPPMITTTTLPDGVEGAIFGPHGLAVSGGYAPYTFALAAGNTPPGLALDANGEVSGTPASAGDYSFVATVTDVAGTSTIATINVHVDPVVGGGGGGTSGGCVAGAGPALWLLALPMLLLRRRRE